MYHFEEANFHILFWDHGMKQLGHLTIGTKRNTQIASSDIY